MASPNMRALRTQLEKLSVTEEYLVENELRPNRWQRRHFRTKTGKVINTVRRPTYTDQFREYYRVQRWKAAHAQEAAA